MKHPDTYAKELTLSRPFFVAILAIALLMQSATPVVFKAAAIHSKHLNLLWVLFNPLFIIGVLLFGGRLMLWQYLLRFFPLSFLHPFQSITLIFILVFSVVLFHEKVTIPNVIGTAIIVLAIILLSGVRRG